MEHHFDVEVAIECGVREAILLYNIDFWIRKNKANNKHCYNGRYWTYNSSKAFAELFPYLTSRVIENLLSKLIENGYLIKDNFNENTFDRTSWYSLTDKYYKIKGNPSTQMGKSIYSNGEMETLNRGNDICITDNKQDNKLTDNYNLNKNEEKNKNELLKETCAFSAKKARLSENKETENESACLKAEIPDIEIPSFDRAKRMTKKEKFIEAMKQFADFKSKNPSFALEAKDWAKWIENAIVVNQSRFSHSAQIKQLEKALHFDVGYVKSNIEHAIAACWKGLHLDERGNQAYIRNKGTGNKPISDYEKRQEQLKNGISGISQYDGFENYPEIDKF